MKSLRRLIDEWFPLIIFVLGLVIFAVSGSKAFGQEPPFSRLQESREQVDKITAHADERDGTYQQVQIEECVDGVCSIHTVDERRPPSRKKLGARKIGATVLGAAIGVAIGGWEGALVGGGIGFGGATLAGSFGKEHREHRESFRQTSGVAVSSRVDYSLDCKIQRIRSGDPNVPCQ